MSTFDLTPLLRSAIGFDRLARQVHTASSVEASSYPPYNIEKIGDDSYRLTMAVAGFRADDLELTVKENTLIVAGRVNPDAKPTELLYRGIATRAFERRLTLADHIVVEGADLRDGLLFVGLKRVVPDQLKPRRIEIGSNAPQTVIANDAESAAQAA
jgi:molecular chaperone IbpA